jgi:hypothetical protein
VYIKDDQITGYLQGSAWCVRLLCQFFHIDTFDLPPELTGEAA